MSKKKVPVEKTEPETPAATSHAASLPTRCRIVEFTSAEQDAETYPAIVTAVHGDTLHLIIFDAVFGPMTKCASLTNNEQVAAQVGTWAWPERH